MATINTGAGILRVNSTKLRRPYEKIEFDDIANSRERGDAISYWQCQTKGPLDVLELYSESTRLSGACATAGLHIGAPIDLRNGSAIYTEEGRNRVWEILKNQKPLIVFLFPESAPWMWMKSKWKKAKARQEKGQHLLLSGVQTLRRTRGVTIDTSSWPTQKTAPFGSPHRSVG